MQCPALTAALLLAVGVLLGSRTDVTTPTLFALAAVIWSGLALILAIRGTDDRWGLWAVVLVILCGAVRGKQSTHDPAPRLVDAHPVQPFEGIVRASPEPRPKGSRVPIDLRFVGPALLPAKGTVLVRFRDFVPDLNAGDRVRVDAALEMPPVARNAGAFDYAAYLRRRGIQRTARVKYRGQIQVTEIGQGAYGVRAIAAIRNHVSEGIRRNLSGAPSAVLQGVLLGDRSALDDDVRTAFTRAGVAHVLAVSGLHVGLIAAGAFFTLRVVGCGRRVTGCLTLLLVWCYALVTGGSASVVRAATMATTVLGGGLFDREGNALNGLGFAAFVLLAWRPGDLHDVGFQLSFGATAGILLFYRPIRRLMPMKDRAIGRVVFDSLAVSLASQVGTLPIVMGVFGAVSIVGLVANLVVVPLFGVATGLGLAAVVGGSILSVFGTLMNGASWLFLSLGLWLTTLAASPSWATLITPPLTGPLTVAYASFCLLISDDVRRRFGCLCLCAGLLALNVQVWNDVWRRRDVLEMHILDVGQGDAVFLRFPNGRTMLVDGGPRTWSYDAGERVVLPFLRYAGVTRLDAVVASHPHSDHIGGLVSVLEQMPVGSYIDAGQPYDSWMAERIQAVIGERGVDHVVVAAGDSVSGLGGWGGAILLPTAPFVNEGGPAPVGLNNGSVVIRLTRGDQSILLTGDTEHETDAALAAWGERAKARILKVAHHGSRTSSSSVFLGAVQPEVALISCGIDNKFKHPSPEVVARFGALGVRVERTDLVGAIRIGVGREGYHIDTWLGETATAGVRELSTPAVVLEGGGSTPLSNVWDASQESETLILDGR